MKRVEHITVSITADTTQFDAIDVEVLKEALSSINLADALEHAAAEALRESNFLQCLVDWGMIQVDIK